MSLFSVVLTLSTLFFFSTLADTTTSAPYITNELPSVCTNGGQYIDLSDHLLNGWTVWGNDYTPPRIYKIGNLLKLSGMLKKPSGDTIGTIFKIPYSQWYPDGKLGFAVSQATEVARVLILPEGDVYLREDPRKSQWLALDGISWVIH